ncbi:MAG TPA: hypothetical protein VK699_20510 [Terriglobales bacterium]|jgi:hypothetical protein|nr:hypothetical protein [Terriglobales bacterium]
MPNARIITRDPESTNSLAAYLRAQGYDVSYSQPGNPHTSPEQIHSDDLVIAVEACVDPRHALARARELAANRNCDVFVGEGVLGGVEVGPLNVPETAAASFPVEPCVSALQQEVIADAEVGNVGPVPEVSEFVSQFAPNSDVLPVGEMAFEDFENKETIALQEELAVSLQENAPAARKPSAMKLGWRALQETKRLMAMQLAALLQRTGGMFQLVKMRTSNWVEAFLLWQQARSAALARRREEERKSREQLRQQAGVKREVIRQNSARRWQQVAGNKPKETTARIITQRIRAIQAGLHLRNQWKAGRFLPHKSSSVQAPNKKVMPIQTAKAPTEQRYRRDWKMVFTGAGVAALLILFVLGVFSGRMPATARPHAEAARQQLPLRTVALTPASRAQAAPPLTIAGAPAASTQANTVTNMKPVAALGAKSNEINFGGSGSRQATASRKRANRTIIEESNSEPEVVVRYFRRPSKRTGAARTVAGIKHYSDQN